MAIGRLVSGTGEAVLLVSKRLASAYSLHHVLG